MSNSTISTMFRDAESARVYMEGKRWPNGPCCPVCGETKRIKARPAGLYRCNACIERGASTDFSVRTGTIFQKSKIPLNKWLYAMYLLITARKGISSMQLAKQIGVTQKSAWFMLQRLREACAIHNGSTLHTDEHGGLTEHVLNYRPPDKGQVAR